MDKLKVEIVIPAGGTCLYENGKPCVLARYTKKFGAYNCQHYHKLLKGEDVPIKCKACLEKSRPEEKAVELKLAHADQPTLAPAT